MKTDATLHIDFAGEEHDLQPGVDFRIGRRGDLVKIVWHDGQGACLFTKKLERGRFIWPSAEGGAVAISSAQLSYLLSGIDWRAPQETWRPTRV